MEAAMGVEGKVEAIAIRSSVSRPSPQPSTELVSRIPSLPHEVIQVVLEQLEVKRLRSWKPRRPADLARCCLVSSTFRQLATPFLYRHLYISLLDGWEPEGGEDDDNRSAYMPMEKVAAALTSRPELGQHVRTLNVESTPIDGEEPYYTHLNKLHDFLLLLPALRRLELISLDDEPLETLTAVTGSPELPFARTLKHLHLFSPNAHPNPSLDIGMMLAVHSFINLRSLDLHLSLDDTSAIITDLGPQRLSQISDPAPRRVGRSLQARQGGCRPQGRRLLLRCRQGLRRRVRGFERALGVLRPEVIAHRTAPSLFVKEPRQCPLVQFLPSLAPSFYSPITPYDPILYKCSGGSFRRAFPESACSSA
ncbi:hypothetical protein BCR35DRAFT_279095 [Leucosporidium creatinivorum]|uniref:F-box domain-containing protein n=1 Tax=Leucosporidium creatinivorum TaxID=106004 RepID=A0A1Y2FA29_9BASI|nr:hypothetical protein BCR35DRAFT_279095 [Leucosporidium creatinivorum]